MELGGDRSLHIEVRCDLKAMAAARAQVVDAASGWGYPSVAELEVVTSELLTNAIAHAGSAATLRCSMDADGAIDIAVSDDSRAMPVEQHLGDVATHGRGLTIIEALAESWGTTLIPGDGKTVWARMNADGSSS